MADPTIQTFCCYTSNSSDIVASIMTEFSPDAYNLICLFSSTLGILGALYQILPRKQFSRNHRWISFSAERGRKIALWLAVSDLLASVGVLLRAGVWLSNKDIMPMAEDMSGMLFCSLSSAWIQYFYTSTWFWTVSYAVDMRFTLSEKEERIRYYHLAAWTMPAVLTSTGLLMLYLPDADCYSIRSTYAVVFRILPNYVVTYIPITIVMIANPCLYVYSCRDMEKIVTCSSGQFTQRERDIVDAVRIKFSAINMVYYMCWFPNLVNAVLLWVLWFDLPVSLIVGTWYTMAFMNPLQALFNCLVYRRWNGDLEVLVLPWNKNKESHLKPGNTGSLHDDSTYEEVVPLLQQYSARSSINRYGHIRP